MGRERAFSAGGLFESRMEQINAPGKRFLGASVEGLEAHLAHALGPEIVIQGNELSSCLRQMRILAGLIPGRLLARRWRLFGSANAEMERAPVGRGAARL